MLRFGVAVAAVLVMVVIIYGTLQAEEEFTDEAEIVLATSTRAVVAILQPQTIEAAAQPYVPPPIPADYPVKPPREYELTGSDILYQVRGGDNPCRFLYTGNRIGTFAGSEIGLWFVAGVWEADLEQYDEMDLYGPNGPHRFYFKDSTGQTTSFIDVARGATVYDTITFEPGLYYLYDRLAPELGAVGEITAAPKGQPAGASQTGWCPS